MIDLLLFHISQTYFFKRIINYFKFNLMIVNLFIFYISKLNYKFIIPQTRHEMNSCTRKSKHVTRHEKNPEIAWQYTKYIEIFVCLKTHGTNWTWKVHKIKYTRKVHATKCTEKIHETKKSNIKLYFDILKIDI